ncbi:hypothetical protein [Glycocaulis sp.]
MALGLRDREGIDGISIHCFDRWTASNAEVEKAAKEGVELSQGSNTLPWVQDKLDRFDVPISYTRGSIDDAYWPGNPISLFVDDATKGGKTAVNALRKFGPSWIPRTTIVVFMDFHFWRKTGDDKHKFHKRLVEAHPESFIPLEDRLHGSVHAFKYNKEFDFSNEKELAVFI